MRVRATFGGAPDLELGLSLADGTWNGHPFTAAAVDLALRGRELQLRRVAVEGPQGRIEAGAALSTEAGELRALQVQAEGADLSLLQEILPLPVNPGGRLTGDLRLDPGDDGALHGGGRLVLEGAELYGETIDHAEAQVQVDGATWKFDAIHVSGPAGRVEGSARLDTDSGTAQLDLDRVEVVLSGVAALQTAGIPAQGTVVLTGAISLSEAGPTGELHIKDVEGSVSGVALAPAAGRVDLFPDHLQISLASPEERTWRIQGTLKFTEDYEVDGVVELEDATFELPSTGTLTPWLLATGRVSVRAWRPAALRRRGPCSGRHPRGDSTPAGGLAHPAIAARRAAATEKVQLEGGSRLEAPPPWT